MSFNENLITLRRERNMSQEDLAEKLNVTRQSVSKWESGNGMPDMENIIAISKLFNIDLDTLIKGNILNDTLKNQYEKETKIFAASIAIGVALIILTVGFAEKLEKLIGNPSIFFLVIGIAVANFIIFSFRNENFKIKYPNLDFKYNEDEVIIFNNYFSYAIAFGVFNIFLGIVLSTLDFENETLMTMIAFSVLIFVYFGILKNKRNLENYNVKSKQNDLSDNLCGITMLIATMVFLFLSFVFKMWTIAWIVFPIGGILCAIISIFLENNK